MKAGVAVMALAIGASIAGSISGTVAWYQYSTRSSIAYQGASVKCTESLQVRIYDNSGEGEAYNSGWKQDLTTTDVANYLKSAKVGRTAETVANLAPVTSGTLAANTVATSFYKNPIYQYGGAYTDGNAWKAASKVTDYVELPLQFRVGDVKGTRTDNDFDGFLAKKLYVTDLTIASTSTGSKRDITDALRLGIDATTDVTFSKNGGSVGVAGKLDLNADGEDDKAPHYDWDATPAADVIYGAAQNATAEQLAALTATSTKIEKAVVDNEHPEYATRLYADDSNPRNIVGSHIGVTSADGTPLDVKLRIYLEGWQALKNGDEEDAKTLWSDEKFVGATFNLGIRFSAEAAD